MRGRLDAEMKSWMTSVAMYMAIVGVVVVVILAMSALGLFDLAYHRFCCE